MGSRLTWSCSLGGRCWDHDPEGRRLVVSGTVIDGDGRSIGQQQPRDRVSRSDALLRTTNVAFGLGFASTVGCWRQCVVLGQRVVEMETEMKKMKKDEPVGRKMNPTVQPSTTSRASQQAGFGRVPRCSSSAPAGLGLLVKAPSALRARESRLRRDMSLLRRLAVWGCRLEAGGFTGCSLQQPRPSRHFWSLILLLSGLALLSPKIGMYLSSSILQSPIPVPRSLFPPHPSFPLDLLTSCSPVLFQSHDSI